MSLTLSEILKTGSVASRPKCRLYSLSFRAYVHVDIYACVYMYFCFVCVLFLLLFFVIFPCLFVVVVWFFFVFGF